MNTVTRYGSLLALTLCLTSVRAADSNDRAHATFDRLLKKHVGADGTVDYKQLRGDRAALEQYTRYLGGVELGSLSRDEKLATYINAYNAFTLQLILDHWPLKSIMDIPEQKRWKDQRWRLGGRKVSLDQLENEIIRKEFAEPRIHFAVNCASIGCPPLRPEAYVGARLDHQLEEQTRRVLNDPRWARYDTDQHRVHVTKLFDWYKADFTRGGGSVVEFVRKYNRAMQRPTFEPVETRVAFVEWDWALNVKR